MNMVIKKIVSNRVEQMVKKKVNKTMNIRMLLIVFLVVGGFKASAIHLNPQKVIAIPLSSKGLNRLFIKGEGVRDIFLYPGNASEYVTLHKSGDIFISPQEKGTSFSMTVMGSKSVKQDLLLSFEGKAANPIMLEQKPSFHLPSLEMLGQILVQTMHQDQSGSSDLMPALFKGVEKNIGEGLSLKNVGGFSVSLKVQSEGDIPSVITITKASINNQSLYPYVFNPEDIRDAVAICATFETLAPGGQGFIYFINEKKGE